MPIINLGFLGRFRLDRIEKETEPLLSCNKEQQGGFSIAKILGPSYSRPPETLQTTKMPQGIQWCSSASATKPRCRTTQLRRYLVELIALNLRADFDALNAALYENKSISCANSIFPDCERADLLALSNLVRKVHGQVERRSTIDRTDKHHLHKAVMESYQEIDKWGFPTFAFDLIAWYSEITSYPLPWSQTLVGFWSTEALLHRYIDKVELMASFKTEIQKLSMNEEVTLVLERALESSCLADGYGAVQPRYLIALTRDGYRELYVALCEAYEDPVIEKGGDAACVCEERTCEIPSSTNRYEKLENEDGVASLLKIIAISHGT